MYFMRRLRDSIIVSKNGLGKPPQLDGGLVADSTALLLELPLLLIWLVLLPLTHLPVWRLLLLFSLRRRGTVREDTNTRGSILMAIPQLTWIHYWNGSLLLPGVVCVLCVCTWHQREYTPGDLSQPLIEVWQ
jgi:hypothetical protein